MVIVLILIIAGLFAIEAWIVPPPFQPSFSIGFNAFLGAFFSYLFVRLSEAFEKIYRNSISHLNAVVALEHILNYCLDDIGADIYQIAEINKQLSIKDGKLRVSYNRLHLLTSKFDQIIDLRNIDLINDMIDISLKVKRINRDIETLSTRYIELRQSILQGIMPTDVYEISINSYLNLLSELKVFLEELRSRILKSLSIIRVLGKRDKPLFTRIILRISNTRYNEIILREAKEEELKLESEINANKNGG